MSLRDKVIKNTFYHFVSQAFGFLSPFILTPVILIYIGKTEFGMYAIVMGFIGTFGLFDFSISTSFVKFISEYYNKKETENLNKTVNTGLFFYIVFSLVLSVIILIFSDQILGMINIPAELFSLAQFSLYISVAVFFMATSTTIFVSILVSVQKMYVNSVAGLIINILNFGVTYLLLVNGFGLKGILYSQLGSVFVSVFINIYLALKEVPVIKIRPSFVNRFSFNSMGKFGAQMQVSRFSSFISEKYEELLLGYFTILSNVTYFNLAGRVTRLGKFFPLQLFQQVQPVAAELNAKNESHKLAELFNEATKYLTVFSLPIFSFIIVFADLIMLTWLGPGYEMTVYLLRILAGGQLINLMISAPGNSIIPNTGVPKYLMFEGLISLVVNLILCFLLIKYYGIVGAAIGSAISTLIASSYIYITSVRFFRQNPFTFIIVNYLRPVLVSLVGVSLICAAYYSFKFSVNPELNRINGIIILAVCSLIFVSLYILVLWKTKYLNSKDKENLSRLITIINPFKKTIK